MGKVTLSLAYFHNGDTSINYNLVESLIWLTASFSSSVGVSVFTHTLPTSWNNACGKPTGRHIGATNVRLYGIQCVIWLLVEC